MNNHTIIRMLKKTFMRHWRFNGHKIFKIYIANPAPSSGSSIHTWANRGCYKGIIFEDPPTRENIMSDRRAYLYMIKEDFDDMINISPVDSAFNTLYSVTTAMFIDMESGIGYRSFAYISPDTYAYNLFNASVPVQDGLVKIRITPSALTSVTVLGISAALLDGCDFKLAPAQAAPTATGSGIVLFAGGYNSSSGSHYQDITKYIIGSSNTATTFGRLLDQSHSGSATGQTGGRGLFIGGKNPLYVSSRNKQGAIEDINYVTFSTASNTSFFAELVTALYYTTSCSNGDKVAVVGGASYDYDASSYKDVSMDVVQYTSINTPVNCSEFSTITDVKQACCTSNGKLDVGLYAGGRHAPRAPDPFSSQDYPVTAMHRMTLSTKTVSATIGNLIFPTYDAAMVSNGSGNIAVFIAGIYDNYLANFMEYTDIVTGTSMTTFGSCEPGQSVGGSNGINNKAVFRQRSSIYTITINTPANATSFASIADAGYSMCNQDKID